MKRFKITLILFAALLVVSSCDKDFAEINQDPNNPTSLPSHLILPTAIRNVQNTILSTFVGGDMGACWSQQFAKVQYNDEARYIPRQSVIGTTWTGIYANVISQADAMYNLAEAEENNNMMGAALVLQAYGFSLLSDMYGDIPFSEAIMGDEGNISPAYDTQASLYPNIVTMLNQAKGLLGTSGDIDSGSDILYGGDAGLWKKFAASLQFRVLMRMSGKVSVGSQLQSLVSSGDLFSSNAEEAKLIYLSAAPNANPLFETVVFGTRGEWKVNSMIVDMM
ncbi:MAG: SusD/RagB family nutrient-binding outer membrane lipoprotein, partial [Urechidicola sp.]|nr:SusD/RagB family nutrient-binding outer membrane lipoprotein [Urechidicola sp.]